MMLKVMMQDIAKLCAEQQLNMFPVNHGTSECHSPSATMSKQPLDCDEHCQHSSGEHVQAHHEKEPTNTMVECTIDATHSKPNDGQ